MSKSQAKIDIPRWWLILPLAMILLPHLRHLPASFLFPVVAGLLLGAYDGSYRSSRLFRYLKYLLLAASLLLYFVTFGLPAGRSSGAALLVLMAALKPMEVETRASARRLLLMSWFLTAAAFYIDQDLPVAVWLGLAVFLAFLVFARLQPGASELGWKLLWRPLSQAFLAALPLALVLFFLFPRLPGPLWSFPEERRVAVTGLPDELEMGGISELLRSAEVAMRVEFSGDFPPPAELYWRGPVFTRFDGRTWRRAALAAGRRPPPAEPRGETITATATLEPHQQKWLLLLDPPLRAPAESEFSVTREALLARPLDRLRRYRSAACRELFYPSADQPSVQLSQLAIDRNPRAWELARGWFRQGLDNEKILAAALDYLRRYDFVYTLNPPPPRVSGPVDDFLFYGRAGFCEHFAGSLAFLLQSAGIPARVVAGYQGGETHPSGRYLVVRQYHAHAWVEYWLAGRGWERLDPTAVVAPRRVSEGLAAVFPEKMVFMGSGQGVWRRALARYRDLAEFYWNYWVLGYGPKLQLRLLRNFGLGPLKYWLAALVALPLLAAVLGCVLLIRLGGEKLAPELKLYRAYCRRLARFASPRRPAETARSYAGRLARDFPAEAKNLLVIAELYQELRFGPGRGRPEKIRLLRRLCRESYRRLRRHQATNRQKSQR